MAEIVAEADMCFAATDRHRDSDSGPDDGLQYSAGDTIWVETRTTWARGVNMNTGVCEGVIHMHTWLMLACYVLQAKLAGLTAPRQLQSTLRT